MSTERYQAPHQAAEATGHAVNALTALQFARWLKRWVVWLPIAFLLSMLDPVLSPLKWVALVLAGLDLLPILAVRYLIGRQSKRAMADIVDVEASVHDEQDVIELTAIGKSDERDS